MRELILPYIAPDEVGEVVTKNWKWPSTESSAMPSGMQLPQHQGLKLKEPSLSRK